MPRKKGEPAVEWYERAIVANSIAAADLDELESAAEPVSQVLLRSVAKAAKAAAADLDAALEAVLSERRATRD